MSSSGDDKVCSYDPLIELMARFENVRAVDTSADPFAELGVEDRLKKHIVDGIKKKLDEVIAPNAEAFRRAGARRVAVGLSVVEDQLRLSIRDDGKGFSPAGVEGQGLGNLRSRSAALKGQVTITSAPHSGTEVVILVPVPRSD